MSKPDAGSYKLSEKPIYSDSKIDRYATDDPTVYLEYFHSMVGNDASVLVNPNADPDQPFGDTFENVPEFQAYLEGYDRLRTKLMNENLDFLVPEVIEHDVDGCWAVFGIPEGFYTLREVVKSFPDGMNARDIAWMTKRVLILLKVTGNCPAINLDNFLVSPESHSVLLIGKYRPAPPAGIAEPVSQLRSLMGMNMPTGDGNGKRQIDFLEKSARHIAKIYSDAVYNDEPLELIDFGYSDVLEEFLLKLKDIYGPPRYHHLEINPNLTKPFPESS